MSNDLAIPRSKRVRKPLRPPDMISKRGVPYWFGPDWVRELNGSIGRIIPIKSGNHVYLHMLSKDGNVSYIQGSIQKEFLKWHQDREIDCILLGVTEDEIIETNWQYE